MNQAFGSNNSPLSNLQLTYAGGNDPHFSVDRMGTTTGQVILRCENNRGRMVLNEGLNYKVITSSIISGALADGAGLNIKPYLISEIINHFLRITVTPVTPGDSNCDGMVNVLDVIATINHILMLNPQPFCIENADVNSDNLINVIDVIGTINIILGKKNGGVTSSSDAAYLFRNENNIELISDGTLAGIQFEISGAQAWHLDLIPGGFEFTGNVVDGKLIGLVYNMDNTPFPAGKITLFRTRNSENWQWVNLLGANVHAQEVKMLTHSPERQTDTEMLDVTVFPNPARQILNMYANQEVESLRIFNQIGQQVYEKRLQALNTTINLPGLKPGVYLLEVRTSEQVKNLKIIVE